MPNTHQMDRRGDTAGGVLRALASGRTPAVILLAVVAALVGHGKSPPRLFPGKKTFGFRGCFAPGTSSMTCGRLFFNSLLAAVIVMGSGPIAEAGRTVSEEGSSIAGETADSGATEILDCARQPLPILFEGLGLEGFAGRSSIARALHAAGADRAPPPSLPFDLGMSVAGPGSRGGVRPLKLQADVAAPGPLQAIVKSRVSGLDLSAGVDASPDSLQSGPARWVGGIGIQEEGAFGRAELALRTSMRYADTERLIRVEVGPRFERSLGGGVTFFLDGRAEAETAPSMAEPVATLPGMVGSQGLGFVGVTGRTGLVR
jgi:hypothetical protein